MLWTRLALVLMTSAIVVCGLVTMLVAAPSGEAVDDVLEGLAGRNRAQALYELAAATENEDPRRALAWAQEGFALLANDPDPALAIRLQNTLAWTNTMLGQYSEALSLAELARDGAQAAGLSLEEAGALRCMCLIQVRRGYPALGLEACDGARRIFSHLGDRVGVANTAIAFGIMYDETGALDKAAAAYLEALAIFSALDLPGDVAATHNNLGIIYYKAGDGDKALESYREALAIQEQAGDRRGASDTLNNIGVLLFEQGELEQALDHYQRSREIELEIGSELGVALVDSNIGEVLLQQGRPLPALASFEHSLEISREGEDRQGVAATLCNIAAAKVVLLDLDGALEAVYEGTEVARSIGGRDVERSCLETLVTVHEGQRQYEKANQVLKELRSLDRELAVEEARNRITELSLRHELETLLRDRDSHQSELERARTTRFALIASLVAVSLGAVLAIRGYRAEARARNKVRQAHDELTIAYGSLEEVSRTDSLTGISNRRAAQEALESELARVARGTAPFAVVMLDLDYFKEVNDRFGHDAGDKVLRAVAATLREGLRRHDHVARWGGEEFIMLLPETDSEGAAEVAERARRAVAGLLIDHDGDQLSVTITAGVAEYQQGSSAEASIRAADRALYLGKNQGRNQVVVVTSDMGS